MLYVLADIVPISSPTLQIQHVLLSANVKEKAEMVQDMNAVVDGEDEEELGRSKYM